MRVADVVGGLGGVRHAQGDDGGAASLYSEGAAIYRAMGNRLGVAEGLEGLAVLGGEPETARAARAARLLTAVDACATSSGRPPPSHVRSMRARRWGDARFDAAGPQGDG